jgi:hypothetical protein
MAILNFPDNPQLNDQYTGDNGTTYIFDGVKWVGHAVGGAAGTNSIQNGSHVVQIDTSGNLVTSAFTIPNTTGTVNQVLTWPGSGTTLVWADQQGGSSATRWDAVPAVAGCDIYAELTPDYFKAYTQQSHIDLNNNGDWDIGSWYNSAFIKFRPTLDSSTDIVVNNDMSQWTFGTDAVLTLPAGIGDIKRDGVSVLGGSPDGGLADNSVVISDIGYQLQTDLGAYDVSGEVDFTIINENINGTAVATGLIIKGLTTDHTQIIEGSIGANPVAISWGSSGIDYQLWQQVVSITIYVTDSRGYTFYALARDAWEVPHGPCLVEGTQITMADGTHKAIEDIQHGELVRVWNFDLGEFSEAQPIWIKAAEETNGHDVYTFSDGTRLRTVGHHVFNKEAGAFTKLKYAETPVGTTTFNERGEEVTLISKEQVIETTRYYNVWTQYHLNLFADGILTSNRFNNIYPIVDMKFVKDDRELRSLDEFAGIDSKYITGLRLQEQTYSAEYISSYVHDRLERLDIANQVEQGI